MYSSGRQGFKIRAIYRQFQLLAKVFFLLIECNIHSFNKFGIHEEMYRDQLSKSCAYFSQHLQEWVFDRYRDALLIGVRVKETCSCDQSSSPKGISSTQSTPAPCIPPLGPPLKAVRSYKPDRESRNYRRVGEDPRSLVEDTIILLVQ